MRGRVLHRTLRQFVDRVPLTTCTDALTNAHRPRTQCTVTDSRFGLGGNLFELVRDYRQRQLKELVGLEEPLRVVVDPMPFRQEVS